MLARYLAYLTEAPLSAPKHTFWDVLFGIGGLIVVVSLIAAVTFMVYASFSERKNKY